MNESQRFLHENRESLLRLSDILKEADTVKENGYSEYTPRERALAIELTERWIKEAFALSREDSTLPTRDVDNIYLRLEKDGDSSAV